MHPALIRAALQKAEQGKLWYNETMHIVRQYPKLLIILGTFVAAYVLYALELLHWLHAARDSNIMLAALLGGMLFTFGFTTAFGIGILVEIAPEIHPLAGALLGGTAALVADMLIFEAMHMASLHDEINRLKRTSLLIWMRSVVHHERLSERVRRILLIGFAGIIIASPLPDEFGVSIISAMTSLRARSFAMISWFCNTIGILLILTSARLIVL